MCRHKNTLGAFNRFRFFARRDFAEVRCASWPSFKSEETEGVADGWESRKELKRLAKYSAVKRRLKRPWAGVEFPFAFSFAWSFPFSFTLPVILPPSRSISICSYQPSSTLPSLLLLLYSTFSELFVNTSRLSSFILVLTVNKSALNAAMDLLKRSENGAVKNVIKMCLKLPRGRRRYEY